MDKNLMKLVEELKARRVFVSLLMTRTQVQITWWNGAEMQTGDADSVKLWLRGQRENERRELEWAMRPQRPLRARRYA